MLTKEKCINSTKNIINKFDKARYFIDRETILEIAKLLEIKHKENAIVEKDNIMLKKAGNNKKPKIINVNNLFNIYNNITENTKEAKMLSIKIYVKNINGYTIINNIDTNINYELGRKGINKTFSKNVPFKKLLTANKLLEIGEQAIYYETSYDPNDKQGIKYHHFLTPVKLNNKNAIIRSVIKEYTKDKNMKNKFYYHQFEYIEKKKLPT